jgi:hypothetical protein
MTSSCCVIERDCKSVPTKKRWADWVEEDAEDLSLSAPPKAGKMFESDVHRSLKPTEADVALSQSFLIIRLPRQRFLLGSLPRQDPEFLSEEDASAAPAELLLVSLPRQEDGLRSPGLWAGSQVMAT